MTARDRSSAGLFATLMGADVVRGLVESDEFKRGIKNGAQSFMDWWRRDRGEPLSVEDLLKGLGAVVVYEFVRHADFIPTSKADEALAAAGTAYLLWLLAVPQETEKDVIAEDVKTTIIWAVQILFPEETPAVIKWLGEFSDEQVKKLALLLHKLSGEDIAQLLAEEGIREALDSSGILRVVERESNLKDLAERSDEVLGEAAKTFRRWRLRIEKRRTA
jgi:hypothetical protein